METAIASSRRQTRVASAAAGDATCTSHVRGSSVGRSTRWTRSLTTVGLPAASAAQPGTGRLAVGRPAQAEADVALEDGAIEGVVVDPAGHVDQVVDAVRPGVGDDVVVRRHAADEPQPDVRHRAPDRRQRPQHLRHALLLGHQPKRRERDGACNSQLPTPNFQPCWARSRLDFLGVGRWESGVDCRRQQVRRTMANHMDVEPWVSIPELSGERWKVDGDGAGGGERDGGQRPDRRAGVAQAGEDPFGDARRRVGMAEGQLGAQIVRPAAGDQRMRPRLVQLRVVQHDQAGVAGEVGPHVVVAARVAELVDDQIERLRVDGWARSRRPTGQGPRARRPRQTRPIRTRASDRRAAQTSSPTNSAMSWRAARAGSTIAL